MTEFNFTDVSFEEVDSDMNYTAVQVAKIIDEDISTVRSWCSEKAFELELNLKRVNGRRIYSKKDIENLKFIKALRDKNMPIKQIKEYISKHGFQYREYNAGLINPEDPMGFDVLAERIAEKNKIQMESFLKSLIEYNENFKNDILEQQRRINEELRDEILEQHEDILKNTKTDIENLNKKTLEDIDNHNKNLENNIINFVKENINKQTKEINEKLETNKNSIEELAIKRDINLVNDLKKTLEANKEIAVELEKSNQKTSFFSRLFNRK